MELELTHPLNASASAMPNGRSHHFRCRICTALSTAGVQLKLDPGMRHWDASRGSTAQDTRSSSCVFRILAFLWATAHGILSYVALCHGGGREI